MVAANLNGSAVDSLPREYIRELGLLGAAAAFSCSYDPRASYYLYAPRRYFELETAPLLVLVHGSNRNAYQLREWYQNFAELHNAFLLCPLFPTGLIDPNDTDNYKAIEYSGIRYDAILLQMIEEAVARYPRLEPSKFCLYGFSGGGQFVHRFTYLHPNRVQALVCGAPGSSTEWDFSQDYPRGVKDLEIVFDEGTNVDWKALQAIPTLFLCGSLDTDDTFCKVRGRPPLGPEGRLGSCKRLAKSWRRQRGNVTFLEIEDAKHEERKFINAVCAFIEKVV